MKVRILRQKTPSSESYWETFNADVPGEMSVAGLIDHINYNDDIIDENGRKTTRIGWECSCLQGICGACAMVINGVPALACETFVKDLKGSEITIRPLRKFPVIHDLVTDRTIIQENLTKTNVFIREYKPAWKTSARLSAGASAGSSAEMSAGASSEEKRVLPRSRRQKKAEEEYEHQYTAAKCLKCGLCLEICPNYTDGKTFFGALFANDCYLVSSRNPEKASEIRKCYGEHFGSTCSKALSCMDVCPMHIPTIASMGKMNRRE